MAKTKAFTIGFDEIEIQKLALSIQKMRADIEEIQYAEIAMPQPYVPKQAVIKPETDPNLEALLVEVNRRIDAAYKDGWNEGHAAAKARYDTT